MKTFPNAKAAEKSPKNGSASLQRRGLLILLSTLVCLSMLIGATFAWFSDRAETGINTVTAGNLHVALEWRDDDGREPAVWRDAADRDLFADAKADMEEWEPGMAVLSDAFHVANKGTLALEYRLTVGVVDETETSDGSSLSAVIQLAVLNAEEIRTIEEGLDGSSTEKQRRDAYVRYIEEKETGFLPLSEFTETGKIYPKSDGQSGETAEQYILLYWKPNDFETDNRYNGKDADITFGIHVNATQTPYESDTFGPNYDGGIELPTAEEMQAEQDAAEYEKGNVFRVGRSDGAKYMPGTVKEPDEEGLWGRQTDILDVVPADGRPLVLTGDYSYEHDGSNLHSGFKSQYAADGGRYRIDLNGHTLTAPYLWLRPAPYETPDFRFELGGGTFTSVYAHASNLVVDGAESVRLYDLILDTLTDSGETEKKWYSRRTDDVPGWDDPLGSNSNGPVGLVKVRAADDGTVELYHVTAKGGASLIQTAYGTVNIDGCTFSGSGNPLIGGDGYKQADPEALYLLGTGMKLTMRDTTVKEKQTRLSGVTGELTDCTLEGGLRLENSRVTLTGCTVKGELETHGSANLKIVSGTYSFEPSYYQLAEGSTKEKQGDVWVVTPGTAD